MVSRPIRKRMVRRDVPGGVRFLTFSCERRRPLFSNPAIAEVFVARLGKARAKWGLKLHAWVVMPEHVHLLMLPPEGVPMERILEYIKKSVGQRVIARWRQLNAPILQRITDHTSGRPRFWQPGGGFDRNVRDAEEMTRELRYIHRNPVERGLCLSPTEWAFSSARWWARYTGVSAPEPLLDCDPLPGSGWENWKGWE